MTDTTPRLRITRRSGKVRVTAEPGAVLSVAGGTSAASDDGTIEIRANGHSTLDVRCAAGTDLTISTASGNIDVRGDAGSVKVITKSGNVTIESATAVNARGASGRVEVGACTGECQVVFVSSNVHIGRAGRAVVSTVSGNIEVQEAGDAEVKTVSGKVTLGCRGGGQTSARSISGSVDISVPDGSRPDTQLKAVSGRIRCDCEQGHDGEIRREERERVDLGHMPVTTVTGTIMFTDIVGFTQLTDEHGDDLALTLLERQEQLVRRSLPDTARVVKELGDGLLLWFDEPGAAIVTALELQRAFEDESDDDMPMWVRIGLHWGCPRARGDDIVGRDVNLASRIMDLAAPGEVLCSEATALQAGDVPGVGFEPLGPVYVRGIADPIELVRAFST